MPLVPRLLRPSVIVRRNALYKGLLGGSKGWLAVGGVLWSKSFLKKTFGRNEELLTVEKLTKGQFLRIDAVTPPSRRQRRRMKRRARRDADRLRRDTKAAARAEAAARRAQKIEKRRRREAEKRIAERELRSVTGA